MGRQGRDLELLIAKIQELNHIGAEIKSPDFIPDIDTGEDREIDVSVRVQTGEGVILIALECRDRGSVQDVTWVEQLASKKKSVGADVMVAITSSSFSEPAKKKAHREGIRLRRLDSISDEELLKWTDETYVEIHSVKSDLEWRDFQLLHEGQHGVSRPWQECRFYDKGKNRHLDFNQFLDLFVPDFLRRMDKKIPSKGDALRAKAQVGLVNAYVDVAPKGWLIAQYVKIHEVQFRISAIKVIERYPISSLQEYSDAESDVYTGSTQVSNYAVGSTCVIQEVANSTGEAHFYLNTVNLDLGGKLLTSIIFKCREPRKINQYSVKT